MRTLLLATLIAGIAAAQGRCVTLTWQASASEGVAGYVVYRSMTSGEGRQAIGRTWKLDYIDRSVKLGATYYYVVTAIGREAESAPSNEAVAVIPLTRGECVAPRPVGGRVRISGRVGVRQ